MKIKKNDIVEIIAGKDKGKKGKVLRVFPKIQKAVVENINIIKKARRKTQEDQKGGIVEIETPLNLSNLMLVCKQCSKRIRTKISVLKDGAKIRECKKCGAAN
ncbi:MAG: 50S ribosomal protein L24 [Candidatus Omnitrophica bacterium]|nr:50S ribosomal protein L24 [Candidatus Omnitrophota bacterium]